MPQQEFSAKKMPQRVNRIRMRFIVMCLGVGCDWLRERWQRD